MEVLGAVGSGIALLDSGATGVRKILQTLKRLQHAPQELRDLFEQVEALETAVSNIWDAQSMHNAPQGLSQSLDRLRHQLLALQEMIHYRLLKPSEELKVDRIAWTRHKIEVDKRLSAVQKTLGYTSVILTAATVLQADGLRRQMEAVLLMQSQGAENQSQATALVLRKLDTLTALCERLQAQTFTGEDVDPVGGRIGHAARHQITDIPSNVGASNQQINVTRLLATTNDIDMASTTALDLLNNKQKSGRSCPRPCRCRCHKRRILTLPSSLRSWIGSLSVAISNPRWSQVRCSVRNCQRKGDVHAAVQYAFPPWIANVMISALYKGTQAGSIERVIRLVQIAHTNAYYLAQRGDLVALRELYMRGEASVYDVDSNGDNALYRAVHHRQYAVARFLVTVGCDPVQRNLVGTSASDQMLETALDRTDPTASEELSALIDIDDALEDQNFTLLHRIIVGRSSISLADGLAEFPDLIDCTDIRGRTPLYWAVKCKELEHTRTLLSHGADIAIMTLDQRNVFDQMALCDNGLEVFELIRNGVPDVQWSNEDILRCLSAQNSYGNTPWLIAIWYNRTTLLQSFLQYELDLSVKTFFGRTLFHSAARFANTGVLGLLATVDIANVDLMAVDAHGLSAVQYVGARLACDVFWAEAPPHSEEALVALIKLVAHMRTTETRLPRLIYCYELGNECPVPKYGLLHPSGRYDIHVQKYIWDQGRNEDLLATCIDVEDWVEAHGNLQMPDPRDVNRASAMGLSTNVDEHDVFFDASDWALSAGQTEDRSDKA